jgi:dihydroflavonol-4-reductase
MVPSPARHSNEEPFYVEHPEDSAAFISGRHATEPFLMQSPQQVASATADGHDTSRRTAFVTGATGFLGLNVIAELESGGWEIIALRRPSSDLSYLRRFPVRMAEGAVEDLASLERAMPESVDAVFHVAGDVSLWSRNNARQTRTNVEGTRCVVEAALKRGAKKFVHTSSSTVYGFAAAPFDETAPHRGRGSWINYMHTKTLSEDEVRRGISRGLDAVFINPCNVIGRYDQNNWARLIRLVAEGKLPRVPPGRAAFSHGTEVARGLVAAAARGRTGENYLLAGANASYRQVVQIVGEVVGHAVDLRMVGSPMLRLAGRVSDWASYITNKEPLVTAEAAAFLSANLTCRSDKAIKELGYRPVPLRTMLEDCYRWLVEEKILKAPNSAGN